MAAIELINGDEQMKDETVQLKKSIGFIGGCALIVGTVIGSGIFITPKGVLNGSGSVGMCLTIWAICGVSSLLACLTFVELGTVVPNFGGIYIYLLEGFAPNRSTEKSWWRPLPAFLYVWQFCILGDSIVAAVKALTCAEYLSRLASTGCSNWAGFSSPTIGVKLLAVTIILLTTFINCYSVDAAMKAQTFFSLTKLFGIALIIAGGAYMLANGHTEELDSGFEGSNTNFADLATAFYSGLWAYSGWFNLNYVTKEMKNPKRDLPYIITISTAIVTFCYIMINVSFFTALTKEELLASETVAVAFGGNVAGVVGEVVMIILVVSSVFGSLNGGVFIRGRLAYAAAEEGQMISLLSYVQKEKFTPAGSISFSCVMSLVMILGSDIFQLINLGEFTFRIFMILVMISLILLRKNRKDADRPIKVPLIIPAIEIAFSIMLLVIPFIDKSPRIEYLYGLAYLTIGVIVYFVFVFTPRTLPGTHSFTKLMQIILLTVPPDKDT